MRKQTLLGCFALLLGCSASTEDYDGAPPKCVEYLDCLARTDSNAFDDEVAEFGGGGECLAVNSASTCEQICAANIGRTENCGDNPVESPAPGVWGGLCLVPDGRCDRGVCNRDQNYCFDPESPCRGFHCGGESRGMCVPSNGQPSCSCAAGFENDTFALYCCPTDGSDSACVF